MKRALRLLGDQGGTVYEFPLAAIFLLLAIVVFIGPVAAGRGWLAGLLAVGKLIAAVGTAAALVLGVDWLWARRGGKSA